MTDRALAGCALLPCPWCGSAPLAIDYSWVGRYGVACNNDACAATTEMTGSTEAEAIERWNRRAPSRDEVRLLYLAKDGCVEGFVHVKQDIYDYAFDSAEEAGRDEPNDADLLSGIRRLVDAAIAAAEGEAK